MFGDCSSNRTRTPSSARILTLVLPLALAYNYILYDDAFFNRDWARACRGRWAGPGLLAGWAVGSWIVWVKVGSLQCWFAGSGRGTPLQKQERRGVGEGFARGRSDA